MTDRSSVESSFSKRRPRSSETRNAHTSRVTLIDEGSGSTRVEGLLALDPWDLFPVGSLPRGISSRGIISRASVSLLGDSTECLLLAPDCENSGSEGVPVSLLLTTDPLVGILTDWR